MLENSKHQIKTDYLNFYAIKQTVLPNILDIFKRFELFDHLSAIFFNQININENEVVDEYQDLEDMLQC